MKKKYKKRRYKMKKKWFYSFLTFLFLGLFIFSLVKIFTWHKDNKKIKELTDNIEQVVTTTEKKEEGDLINPPEEKESDYWYYIKVPFLEVDFKKLLKTNSDTVAFVHLNNTNINYPVVQTGDNKYYLTHAFDKSKNDAGWVYMDYRNNKETLSKNTVLYGHGRLDKTVFGDLKKTLTKGWQKNKDNYTIQFSTATENMVFQIFSIYSVQSESYYITTDFSSDKSYQKWLDTMVSRNKAPITTAVSTSDHVITLSTCLDNDGGRVVVHGKLIKRMKR